MRMKISFASSNYVFYEDVDTIQDLFAIIEEYDEDIIITKNLDVIVYDGYME